MKKFLSLFILLSIVCAAQQSGLMITINDLKNKQNNEFERINDLLKSSIPNERNAWDLYATLAENLHVFLDNEEYGYRLAQSELLKEDDRIKASQFFNKRNHELLENLKTITQPLDDKFKLNFNAFREGYEKTLIDNYSYKINHAIPLLENILIEETSVQEKKIRATEYYADYEMCMEKIKAYSNKNLTPILRYEFNLAEKNIPIIKELYQKIMNLKS